VLTVDANDASSLGITVWLNYNMLQRELEDLKHAYLHDCMHIKVSDFSIILVLNIATLQLQIVFMVFLTVLKVFVSSHKIA
jgi:hypothetical protein